MGKKPSVLGCKIWWGDPHSTMLDAMSNKKRPYKTPAGAPRHLQVSDAPADAFENMKTAIFHLYDGSWPHRISSSTVMEFLIWWFHATYDEKKTEVKMKDFRPITQKGASEGYQFYRRPVTPATIRKLAGVDPSTKRRKL